MYIENIIENKLAIDEIYALLEIVKEKYGPEIPPTVLLDFIPIIKEARKKYGKYCLTNFRSFNLDRSK